jgi:hypothetical protein
MSSYLSEGKKWNLYLFGLVVRIKC